jgi:hypothetical protein
VRALLTRTWNRLLAAAVFQRFIEPPIVSGVTHSLTSIHIFLGSFDRLSILSLTRIASSTRTALQPSLMAVTQFRLLIPVIALHSSQPRKRRLTPMSSDANANHTPTTAPNRYSQTYLHAITLSSETTFRSLTQSQSLHHRTFTQSLTGCPSLSRASEQTFCGLPEQDTTRSWTAAAQRLSRSGHLTEADGHPKFESSKARNALPLLHSKGWPRSPTFASFN